MRTCLIVATWSGDRRWLHPIMKLNRAFYVESQIKYLGGLKHSLDKIIFVVPKNKKEPSEFTKIVDSIDGIALGSSFVEVIRRPNIGFSYGSYLFAINKFKDLFDYYLFIEDDYVFEVDNFDKIMLSLLDDEHGAAVGVIGKGNYQFEHLMVSNGIVSWDVLSKSDRHLWRKCFVPQTPGHRIQLRFSKMIMGATKCRDVGPCYSVLFRARNGAVALFHPGGELLMRGL